MRTWVLVGSIGLASAMVGAGCEGAEADAGADAAVAPSMDGALDRLDGDPAGDASIDPVDRASVDARPVDAHRMDTHPDDATPDAGPLDAAAPTDAQTADARVSDGAVADAGQPVDGGRADARPDGTPCVAGAEPDAPCNALPLDVDHAALYGGLDLDALDAAGPGAPACTPEEVAAAFDGDGARLDLACSLTFPAGGVLRKNLRLQGEAASGVTVDCGGGRIDPAEPERFVVRIQSVEQGGAWSRPRGIRFVDCHIVGAVRVIGLGRNGEAEGVRLSSHQADHTARAQQIAPSDVLFLRVHIEATGAIPFYVAPGATRIKLVDSRLSGVSASTAIYLDAESAFNVIQNTTIETTTAIEREVIAVDGSAHNLIAGNIVSSLHRGGVYVYRNCGEGGTVRHQRPRFNRIVGNEFRYDEAGALNPAVWLGTRQGLRLYCPDDAGHPFGSSVSDLDYADFNLVTGNRLRDRDPAEYIWDNGDGNRIDDNRAVVDGAPGRAPCGFFDSCRHHVVADGACFSWGGEPFVCADGHLLPE